MNVVFADNPRPEQIYICPDLVPPNVAFDPVAGMALMECITDLFRLPVLFHGKTVLVKDPVRYPLFILYQVDKATGNIIKPDIDTIIILFDHLTEDAIGRKRQVILVQSVTPFGDDRIARIRVSEGCI